MTYDELEERISEWARTQPAVRAVLACGSRARGANDRWSDLDTIILTTDRVEYAANSAWLHAFGEPWLTYVDTAGPGDPEWFALYDDGLKLDAVLLRVDDASVDLDELLKIYPYQRVFARGLKVLYDSMGEPRSIPPVAQPPVAEPTAAEFAHVVNGFLLETMTTAKFIGRGDAWRAQLWLANDLRPRLLRVVEWHAYGKDTWYNGRHLSEWADPRAAAGLPQSFALCESDSLKRAMRTMLSLMRTLGAETAARFGFEYPAAAHERVAALVETMFST